MTIKELQAQLDLQQEKQQAEMQILNILDELEDSFHINQIMELMSDRDRKVYETLNTHAPKLVSKYIDMMILR